MYKADIIIVFPREPKRNKTVRPIPKFTPGLEPRMTINEVYQNLAVRVREDLDTGSSRRKCVVRSDWAYQCIAERRMIVRNDRDGWEIKFVLKSPINIWSLADISGSTIL
jgi:hypothetical protein